MNDRKNPSFVNEALGMVSNGLSVVPVKTDKKPTARTWKRWQAERMTPAEVREHFARGVQIALIGGAVSGNLECLDFDRPDLYRPFLDTLESIRPDLPQKLTLRQKTPSGGYHLIYRCAETVGGSVKLARSAKYTDAQGHPRQDVYIESRGEGGYFLVHPSYAVPHGGGQPVQYQMTGSFDVVPVITAEEKVFLHTLARSFDEGTEAHHPEERTGATGTDGDRPGDRFNQKTDWHTLLTGYGWTLGGTVGDRQHWTRPGKTDGSVSATLHPDRGLYVFSTNTPLPTEKPLSKFSVFACYAHGGDFQEAARELARRYGMDRPATTRITATTGEDRQCEWPEPLPLFTGEDSKPYPIEALPIILRHAVQEVVDFVQCPTPLAACSALSVVSLVTQSLVDVQRAESLRGPSSLYLLALAESGERKSTVDGHFSAPIREWEREQVERLKPLATKHNANMEAWQAEKAGLVIGIRDAMKGGRDTSDLKERMVQLEENKPTPPRVPRMLFSDSTPEALATRLASSYPTGAVLSAEAGTVLGGHAMKNDSSMRNMALLNALWSGEQITVDRKAEGGSFILRGARLTMGLAVQPATIRQFIDQQKGLARGIGWLARFLVAWPESTQGQRFFRDAPSTWPSLSALHRRLANLLDHPLNCNNDGELCPAVVELSPDAKIVWRAFHDDVETELRPGREMAECRDVASKAADNAARLAAIFHVLENGPVGQVSADNMRSAARLAGWHLYEARRFLGEMAAPVHVNHARRLDDWLLERCRGGKITLIPTRDILREGPPCVRCSSALDAAIEELAEAGRARLHKDGRRRFVAVNPALLSEV